MKFQEFWKNVKSILKKPSLKVFYEIPKEFWKNVKSILEKTFEVMRKFLNIVSVWNFRSVLMRLSKISIKVSINVLLGLKENFEKILEGFRVYFAKIVFRTPEENFEKVLCNRKNFMVISKHFWLNLENNEKNLGEIGRFSSEIVKRLRKFIRCPRKFRKILKINAFI